MDKVKLSAACAAKSNVLLLSTVPPLSVVVSDTRGKRPTVSPAVLVKVVIKPADPATPIVPSDTTTSVPARPPAPPEILIPVVPLMPGTISSRREPEEMNTPPPDPLTPVAETSILALAWKSTRPGVETTSDPPCTAPDPAI